MDMSKVFSCEKCDRDMDVEDVYNTDLVSCHNCGQEYTLRWLEEEEAWELIMVEPFEEEEGNIPEEREEDPFHAFNEPAAPRDDDFDRY